MKAADNFNAIFEYPGQVIIVDDDINFSSALAARLRDKFSTSVFNSPREAIQFFETNRPSIINSLTLISELNSNELDIEASAFVIDYKSIAKLIGDVNRYNEPTVLIVDYQMPGMTGLEFLAHVRNRHVKKILLTAYDEKSIAVNAFNQGLIDRYLVKEPEMLETQLNNEINTLNQEYFRNLSSYKLGRDLLVRLYDAAYEKLLTEWITKYGIQEYYRVDDSGSVLGLTHTGHTVWLALQTREHLDTSAEIYNAHHKLPLTHDKMIYLFSEIEEQNAINDWSKYIYTIEGQIKSQKTTLYYSTIKDEVYSLNVAKS